MISGNQLEILQHFKSFLSEAKLSSVSIKNYMSDIRRYFEWLQTNQGREGTIRDFTESTAKAYLNYLEDRNTPQSTVNRYLASYRRFLTFLKIEYRYEIAGALTDQIHITPEKLIQQFRQSLTSERKSPATIKNYISDVNHYWTWIANLNKSTVSKALYQSFVDPQLGPNLPKIISENTLSRYQEHLKDIHTSTSVINRRESALKKFSHFAFTHKLISQSPRQPTTTPNLLPLFKNTPSITISPQSGLLAKTYYLYHRLPFVPYLHLALLVLFGSAITIFGYNQIFKEAGQGQAYPTSLVRPSRQLSFQGRLTNNDDSPISQPSQASFKLYNQAEEGQELYASGECSVTPDSDGVFNVLIGGGSCGTEVGSEVFTENQSVYLEVSVGGQTLSPRQQIATVGYAINSETLQGYPASPSATENTIPIVNNNGEIILGSLSPSIESSSGTFALKGQALTFATNPGSDGNIILAPDGTGQVKIMGGTTKKPTLFVSNANLTTGSLIEGYIGNNTSTGNLLHLASGSRMINRVTINAMGQTLIEPAAKGKAAFILNQLDSGPVFTASSAGKPRFLITNDGRVGIGTSSPNEILDVYGRINLAAVGGPGITTDKLYNDSGSLFWDGGKVWTSKNDGTGSGLDADLLDGLDSGQFLRSDRSTAYTNGILTFFDGTFLDLSSIKYDDSSPQGFRLPQNTSLVSPSSGEGYLAWNTTSNTVFAFDGTNWIQIAGGGTSSKWRQENGALSPLSDTLDVLIGSAATASAKFAFYNVNSGTPTASISAGAAGALSLTATGTIATTNKQTLTIGTSESGRTGFYTSSPLATVDIRSIFGTIPVASISGATSMAALIVDNSGVGDIFTASSSGLNRFVVKQNGKVGIGTDVPSELLEVVGSATISGNLTLYGGTRTIASRLNTTLTIGDSQTGNIVINPNGNIGIKNTAPIEALDVTGNATVSGNLTLYGGVRSIQSALNTTLTIGGASTGNILAAPQNGATGAFFAPSTDNQVDLGSPTLRWRNIYAGDSGVQGFWQRNSGSLAPTNLTDDLLLGSTATTSARFAFYNVAADTPTASISGSTANAATYLTGNGLLATRNNQSLTIGAAGTGNIVIAPGGVTALTAISADLTAAGDLSINGGDLTTTATTFNLINTTATTLNVGGVATTLNLGPGGATATSVNMAGGSGATGCTVDGATGDLTCTGNVSGGSSGTQGYWQRSAGVLTPINITDDVTLGSTSTSSAKFAFYNVAAGTPTASISAGAAGALSITSTGTISTTTSQSLTLGTSTTGNVIVNPGGRTGFYTTSPLATVDIRSIFGTIPVASISGATSMAALIVDNSGVGDIFTASSSGLNRFVVKQDGKVGIGTDVPSELLEVVGSATVSGNLTLYGGTRTIASRLNTTLTIGDSQTGNIVINPNGNIGIKNTAPIEALDVTGNATISGNLTLYGGARTIASRLSTTLTIGDAGTGNLSLAPQNGATGAFVAPSTDNQVDLGQSNLRWRNIYGSIIAATGDGTQGYWQRTSGSLAPYFISDSLNIGATATTSAFVHLAGTAGEDSFIFTGNTGLGTRSPLARLDVRGNLGTTAAATISGTTSFAALAINNSIGDIFTASATATTRLTLQNAGHLLPGVTGQQNLGSSTQEWGNLNLTTAIIKGGTSVVNVATRTLGGGDWTFGASASVSSSLYVADTACIGFNPASAPTYAAGCTGNSGALMIVGVTGTGKIDVGTVDPPYTINGEKYATFLPAMMGVREEVTGNLTTNEFVQNVGFRTIVDFNNLPKASDLWLFSKVTSIKTKMDGLSVLLTPEGSARAWYEIDQNNKLLIIYTSKPTSVSYRLSATRFDGSEWKNTRDAGTPGFVINDPDQNYLDPRGYFNPTAGSYAFKEDETGSYSLSVDNKLVQEISSLANALIANLQAGLIKTQKLVSPIAEVDELTVKNRLISPLAEIETVIASTISAETITAEIATISGTLYAAQIESPTIDSLNTKYEILDSRYATASSILASIQEKYQNFDRLNITTETGPNASISGNLTLNTKYEILNTSQVITDNLMVNTTLLTNSLNSIEGTLFIQPTANSPINLLAGLMVLNPDGKVTINGDLIVNGKILAKKFESVATTPNENLLALYNENGEKVGAINSSGSAEFKDVATGNIVTRNLIIAAPQIASGSANATSSATPNSNASIGTATIPAGSTELEIRNNGVNNSTYVYLTPISDSENQVLFVKSKQEGVGFIVAINQPITNDLKFNYWLIETR